MTRFFFYLTFQTENINRKRSPFETQNKENSPVSTNSSSVIILNQPSTNTTVVNQRNSFYQSNQANLIQPKAEIDNKTMFTTKNNLTNLNGIKSASNINLVKISNPPNSKPGFNPNLSAATAAAAAAIEQQKTDNLTRIFQSYPDNSKREQSVEKVLDSKIEPVKTLVNKTSNSSNASTNVLKRAMNFEQKNISEQIVSKSSTPLASDNNSSIPSSRRNSPLKTVTLKTSSPLAQTQNEDVEMISSASSTSNKENNSESNDVSNEPSKLSISEKMKLFSGSNTINNNGQNSVTFTSMNINQNKKSNTQNITKINFNKVFNFEICLKKQ